MPINRRALLQSAAATFAASGFVSSAFAAPEPTGGDPQATLEPTLKAGPFAPDWSSLQGFRAPAWYCDAKFGIFIHWGVYSVPAFANEWYSRNMYVKGSAAYDHHVKTYGPQDKFGYKDFIPKFTARKFDPDAWVDLFVRAGARFVVPVAEHCDGFAMYDSDVTKWNAAKMGPKRDVVGALEKAVRKRGLHFGVSSHRAEHWWWYHEGTEYASDVNDPKNVGIYGPAAPMTLPDDRERIKGEPNSDHLERWFPPSKEFLDDWQARSVEMIVKYKPDLVYYDWWINHPAFEPYLRRIAAYYYNAANAAGIKPVMTYKMEAFAPGAGVLDIERGRLDALRLSHWQSETSVSIKSWGFAENDEYRTPESLLIDLVDVVSKNGTLLLNVGPKADGTIPAQAANVLLGMGAWLKVNGESIYDSSPWIMYGEGDTSTGAGEKQEKANRTFTSSDIRFTAKDNVVYAFGLAWPEGGKAKIKTLYQGSPYVKAIKAVRLLGSQKAVVWTRTPTGLEAMLPETVPMPYVLKIEMA